MKNSQILKSSSWVKKMRQNLDVQILVARLRREGFTARSKYLALKLHDTQDSFQLHFLHQMNLLEGQTMNTRKYLAVYLTLLLATGLVDKTSFCALWKRFSDIVETTLLTRNTKISDSTACLIKLLTRKQFDYEKILVCLKEIMEDSTFLQSDGNSKLLVLLLELFECRSRILKSWSLPQRVVSVLEKTQESKIDISEAFDKPM
jgi:hypothetical protein